MTATAKREPSPEARQSVADAERLLKTPTPDRDEVKATLKTLLTIHDGWVPALECAALLAPLARNRRAWDYVRDGRGQKMPAYFGYLAFQRFLHDQPTQEETDQWFHLVEDSARRGHFQSRLLVTVKKAPKNRLRRTPILLTHRLYLILAAFLVYLRNPKDDRLPGTVRRSVLTADERTPD